jgi:hypothetical protein
VKKAVTVQAPPEATLDPQLFFSANSVAFAPAITMLDTVNAWAPLFVSVKLMGPLRVPTACTPKSSWLAEKLTTVPVPSRAMVSVLGPVPKYIVT